MTKSVLAFAGAALAKEAALQSTISQALELGLPRDAYFTAIPGGDGRATRAPGYRPGTPDLFIGYRGRVLFIELKRASGGRVSAEQIACHQAIERAGFGVHVARSLDDVVSLIREELECPVNLRLS
jgi:hypothetical protein